MRHRTVIVLVAGAALASAAASAGGAGPALADRAQSGQSRLVVFELIERWD